MDYEIQYTEQETQLEQKQGNDYQWDWENIKKELEQEKQTQKQKYRRRLKTVQHQLEQREKTHEKLVDQLKEEIRTKKQRLNKAERSAGIDEDTVRSKLSRLYTELRSEYKELWQDSEKLLREERDLNEKLFELQHTHI